MAENQQGPHDKVAHQDEIEEVVDDHLAEVSTQAFVADPASPGASYVQAEAVAVRNAVVALLKVAKDSGLMPSS